VEAEEIPFAKVQHEEGDVAVIEVFDERLSDTNVDRLRETVAEALQQSDSLLFDMSHVTYISSVILGAFAAFAKEVKPRGGAIKVCEVTHVVLEVLKSMRFDVLLDPQPDREAGLAKIREET
jgi:anti-anti-sigma factor